MEPILFGIVMIPLAISLGAKFILRWNITWLEWAVQMGVIALVVSLIWYGGRASVGADREVLNGAVTHKERVFYRCPTNTSNPCQNGYDCNCVTICTPTTDGKGNVTGQSCSTTCDTCYRYPWEQDWNVHTTVGDYQISRVDAQGANTPPRWTRAQPGDAASTTHPYKNWVKASAKTLFRDSGSDAERFKAILPAYPITIFDYYRIDRVLTPNVKLPNEAQWNDQLGRMLGQIGRAKQVNMVLVFVDAPREYAPALRYHWQGFKKNDAVMVIGVNGGRVGWAEVMSWSKDPTFNVAARRLLETYAGQPVSALSPPVVIAQIKDVAVQHFQRRPMEEFEYLKGDIPPPRWLIWTAALIALISGLLSSYLFHRVDLDGHIFSRNSGYGSSRAGYSFTSRFRR